ncbi:MAG: MFS transporter [Nonomuraea sp.]|nr:MFS transporter [Nonomuraea sp.]
MLRSLPVAARALLWVRTLNALGAYALSFLAVLAGPALAATALALFGAMALISRWTGAFLLARFSPRAVLATGLAATGLSLVMLAFARGPAQVLPAIALVGLAFELYEPASQELVARASTGEQRHTTYAVMGVALSAAGAAAGVLAAVLLPLGVRWLVAADALTCLTAAIVAVTLLPRDTPRPKKSPTHQHSNPPKPGQLPSPQTPSPPDPLSHTPSTHAPPNPGPSEHTPSDHASSDRTPSDHAPSDRTPSDHDSSDHPPSNQAPSGSTWRAASRARSRTSSRTGWRTPSRAWRRTSSRTWRRTSARTWRRTPSRTWKRPSARTRWRPPGVLVRLTAASTAFAVGYLAVMMYLPLALLERGAPPWLPGLTLASTAALAPLTLWASRRLLAGRPHGTILAMGTLALGLLALVMAATTSVPLTIAACLGCAAVDSVLLGRWQSLVADAAPENDRPRWFAFQGSSWGVAQPAVPPLATLAGTVSGAAGTGAFLAAGIAFLLVPLALRRLLA